MQNVNPVDSIVIVGGGTSAWLAAAMLSHTIPHLSVTIVDKEIGSPVGVGEGTLLSFNQIMSKCGFSVEDWLFEIDATYKSGILFPGWGENQEAVWHPFMFEEFDRYNTTALNCWTKNQDLDFKNFGLNLYDVSVTHDKVDTTVGHAYAFHIDASKLVAYIQDRLSYRPNVKLIKSEVVDIRRLENNHINELVLKNGQLISADLFVDCTGFKGLLNYEPQRVDLNGRLWCDTAVAGHVPYADRDKELHPYVISEQIEHGWIWNIPVQSRIGSGLVFNRSCTDIETAKKFFCDYWDNRISSDKLKVIDWTPYYNRNPWHENVVAIGLSNGFIEPLESTGIALIIAGVEQLTFALESRFYTDDQIKYFNLLMSNFFEDAIDFVSMHYANATRQGKIWDMVRSTFKKSHRMKFYEKELKSTDRKLPIKGTGYMFTGSNWMCWLIQMGYPVGTSLDHVPKDLARNLLTNYYDTVESTRYKKSPDHIEYINSLKKYLDEKKYNR
jgi:tryptophan halogenase